MPWLSLGACVPNYKFVPLVILELLAFNAQKIKGSPDPDDAPLFEKIPGAMSRLSLGACVPNLKFISLVILELLAFNTQNLRGHVTLATPPFTLFWHSGVGGRQGTSFELWTAMIGSETTPVKCFNTPIENALCRCQFWGKLGKNKNTFCGTRYLSHCCSLHGTVQLSRRLALNIRVATLTLRLHDVAGHLITLFAMFNSYACFIGTDTNLKSVYGTASTIL